MRSLLSQRNFRSANAYYASGFTLIELMVALALSLFLIGGLLLTYSSGRAASLEAERLSRMQENIRFASDFLIRDIRNAGFRDHTTLTFSQYQQIGEAFARYGDSGNDNSELVVRYAGRGSCGRAFATDGAQKIIENRYFVEDGELICQGNEIPSDSAPVNVPLASGVESISFEFVFPDDAPVATICDFEDDDTLDDACIGVNINIVFQGEVEREMQLTAAFRNVIVDRVYRR